MAKGSKQKSDKLPALQVYSGDWRKDPGIQALDFETRGVWWEILLLMHESEERGKLMLNGKAMPEPALARILGIPEDLLKQKLTLLLEYGVASVCEDTGALINRRMVRDEDIRRKRAAAGKKGGNPSLLKQNTSKDEADDNQPANQSTTPSFSSSTSVNNTHTTDDQTLFRMHIGWVPTNAMAATLRMMGAPPDLGDESELGKFITFWITRRDQKTQAQWEHRYAKDLQEEYKREQRRKTNFRNNPGGNARSDVAQAIDNVDDTSWSTG